MSTKDISRTIVEGGKNSYWKEKKRQERKANRKQEKLFCSGHKEDIKPVKVYDLYKNESFADKLKPLKRLVSKAKQKGVSYNDLYGYLLRKYGRKGMKNHHMLDHFKKDMWLNLNYNKRKQGMWSLEDFVEIFRPKNSEQEYGKLNESQAYLEVAYL